MLKLYTNKEFLTETYRRQVFPLLFDLVFLKNKILLEYYPIVDTIESADVVVLPIDYVAFLKHRLALLSIIKAAKINQKPIWIYTAGDYGITNYISNSFTFRFGGFNSKLEANTFVMPCFINDPYSSFLPQGFSVLNKEEKPNIGFVGHAHSGSIKYLKEFINHLKIRTKRTLKIIQADKQPFYPSSIIRAKYLQQLSVNQNLETQFILRNQYRAGAHSKITKHESSKQFYNNMFSSAYTFCIRGAGNFSVRFYETLAVGRIPILINTDCRLPLLNQIDWAKHCLIIDLDSKLKMVDQIIKFHNSLTELEFENLQKSNRNLWVNTLQRESYFLNVAQQFKTQLQ